MVRPSFGSRGALNALGLRLVGLVGLCAIGCDSMSFTPPRPPELSTSAPATRLKVDAAATTGLKSLDVILAPRSAEDLEFLRIAARVQSGLDKVRSRIVDIPGAGPEATAWSERARAVGEAAAEKPLAILIEAPASPNPELAKAADEARAKGVPVIALGGALKDEAKKEGKGAAASESASTARLVVVVPEPFSLSAGLLVEKAIRNAKTGQLDPKAGAVVLVDTTSDPLVEDRAGALREALKKQGVEAVRELRFAGPDDDGQRKLTEDLKAHPKTTLVLAADFVGLDIADKTIEILREDHPFVMAGYSPDENHARLQTQGGQYAAIAVYSADRLVRKGINVGAALNRGEEVPDRVEFTIPMIESNPATGLPNAARGEESGLILRDDEPGAETAEGKSKAKIELKD